MVKFGDLSDDLMRKYVDGSAKRLVKPIRDGFEVEQSARRNEDGGLCTGILIGTNPENLLLNVPDTVIARSVVLGQGHFDGSHPWEFNLHHSIREGNLLQVFDKIVKKDRWAWHKEFMDSGTKRGCSAHYHVSICGGIDLGPDFDNQRVAPSYDWTVVWNDRMTLMPLTLAAYCHGRRFRESGLNEWAEPVLDRFDRRNVEEIFSQGETDGPQSGEAYSARHDYYALSWNRNQKPQITIENRLNEVHPYFAVPFMQLLSAIDDACIRRGWSIRLDDSYDVLRKYWKHGDDTDTYPAMLKMDNVKFTIPDSGTRRNFRGIPYLCHDDARSEESICGDDCVYPTALDVFRRLTRRFMKMNPASRFGKVMRIWSDFIDFSNLPTHLVWDIDELYRLLYESENKTRYQDEYLYFGSSVVDRRSAGARVKWISEVV